MQKLLVANWKMYLNHSGTLDLLDKYKDKLKKIKNLELAVAPSFPYLIEASEKLKKTKIRLAAQDVAFEEKGAYTGEVSGVMLQEIGCTYTLVGHSERRIHQGETDAMVNKMINQAYNANLIPIVCIGENAEENALGKRDSVLVRQLESALGKVSFLPERELVLAYEPVWAIGIGKFLEAKEILDVYKVIKRTVSFLYSEKFYDQKVRLLYGGSVNSINAGSFWAAEYLHGLLVASASLDVGEFYNIAFEGNGK